MCANQSPHDVIRVSGWHGYRPSSISSAPSTRATCRPGAYVTGTTSKMCKPKLKGEILRQEVKTFVGNLSTSANLPLTCVGNRGIKGCQLAPGCDVVVFTSCYESRTAGKVMLVTVYERTPQRLRCVCSACGAMCAHLRQRVIVSDMCASHRTFTTDSCADSTKELSYFQTAVHAAW